MGMYDKVTSEINLIIPQCPICHHGFGLNEVEWQTKSYEKLLYTVSLRTLSHFTNRFEIHTICPKCNNYLSVTFSKNEAILKYSKNHKDYQKKLSKSKFYTYKLLTEGQETTNGWHYIK